MLAAGLAAAATVAGTTAATGELAQASPRPALTALAGSAVPFASASRATGYVAGSTQLTVQLWLTPKLAAAASYATAASTPGSSTYRHFLSPNAYTDRFAASAAETARVKAWLRGRGFTGIAADSGRNYVRATAPVSTIDAAFRIQMRTYRSSGSVNDGSYALHANDRAVSLPSALAGGVLAVTGLDNAQPLWQLAKGAAKQTVRGAKGARGAQVACSQYYGQHMATGLPKMYGVTSFPTFLCGYSATQIRSAYHASWADTGKGQTIALVEQGLTKDMFLTLQDYAKKNGMPAPSPSRYSELSLGKDSCGDEFDVEEQLDVESSYDMAPGANQLVVGGDSCDRSEDGNQATYDADIAVIDGFNNHPLATVASNSWESGTESQPKGQTELEYAYLMRAAAEGVGMYFSAGDGSGILEPAVDPFSTAVGGTTLGVGQSGNRLFETGWSTGVSQLKNGSWTLRGENGASGGGASVTWPQPAYQQGVVPTSLGTTRLDPDIAADADAFTGLDVGILAFHKGKAPGFFEESIGGTSESAPLVAGMVTAAQQGQAVPFGFLNPALYKLSGTDAFFDTLPLTSKSPALYRGEECDIETFVNICLGPVKNRIPSLTTFDDQSPSMLGYTGQVTLPGYDTMTGLGTPDMPNFTRVLRDLG
jgi:subtilase family serine protease